MKKIIIILLLSSLSYANKSLDLGVRYLKLSNTYREATDFDNAEKYLNKAKDLIDNGSSWDNKYWNAVSYEYSGLINLDRSKKQEGEKSDFFANKAVEDLKRALQEYQMLIDLKDGSQIPTAELLKSVNSIEKLIGESDYVNYFEVLNFEKLKLRDLPRGIPENIKNLTLAENKFRSFPSGISRFTDLVYLNLSYNKIRDIDNSITSLRNLEWLDLSNNKIRNLNIDFCEMRSLEELDLSNNKLKSLTACICDLQNLKILNLKGNKLPYPEIAKLIKCLPNTNIFIDTYILEKEQEN
jgi:hypothetical protein